MLFDSSAVALNPATRSQPWADVDLYVSRDPKLLSFHPDAFQSAVKSLNRGAEELVVGANALSGPYYIAVKCESTYACDFGLAVFFSDEPFQVDGGEYETLRSVPDGGWVSPSGERFGFGLPSEDFAVRRVVVTNIFERSSMSAFHAWLQHQGESVHLQSLAGSPSSGMESYVLDDTDENDWPAAVASAVPGALLTWNGRTAAGPWIIAHPASNAVANLREALLLYPQTSNSFEILPCSERLEYFEAPPSVTNIIVAIEMLSGSGPLLVDIAPVLSTGVGFNRAKLATVSQETVVIDAHTQPPVQPGLWRLRLHNTSEDLLSARVTPSFTQGASADPYVRVRKGAAEIIIDHALTTFEIPVTNSGTILGLEAGVRLDHPRVGDLTLSLVSPAGERVLLQSGRGDDSPDGLGCELIITNIFPQSSAGGPLVASNTFNLRRMQGSIAVTYDFYELGDWMRIFYETNVIFDSGLVSGSCETNIVYGPGAATTITVVMNEGNNSDPDTAWFYNISSWYLDFGFFTYCESTDSIPVKFALPPYNAAVGVHGLRVQPEQPLSSFVGAPAQGMWRLEVQDAYSGPTSAQSDLIEVELAFLLADTEPLPVPLTPGGPIDVHLWPSQVKWFCMNTSPWTTRATNCLLQAEEPLTVLFSLLPPGTAEPAVLLEDVQSGCAELGVSSNPAIQSGQPFYIGLRNDNEAAVSATFVCALSPEVAPVEDAANYGVDLLPGQTEYYSFNVSELSRRVQFQASDLSGEAQLFAKRGLPLPDPLNADAMSDASGFEDESIILFADPPAVPLHGAWYIGVRNTGDSPLSYTLHARQWRETGRPVSLSELILYNGELWLSWNSLTGVTYRVLSSTNLVEGAWTDLLGPVVPENTNAAVSVPIEAPMQFFKIQEDTLPSP